jgi:hypothetical protein
MKQFKNLREEINVIAQVVAETYDLLQEAAGSTAAHMGPAFETSFMQHAHPNKEHPPKFSNEENKTPAEAHAHHHGNLTSEHSTAIHAGAEETYAAVHKHLEQHHGVGKKETLHATWTSRPGQLAKVSGHAGDKNNPGDALLSTSKGKHFAISLKVGEKPGLRSPGLKDLNKMAKVPEHDAEVKQTEIDTHKESLVGIANKGSGKSKPITGTNQNDRNTQFRAIEKSPEHATKVAAIKKSSQDFRSGLATHYANHFSKLSHADKSSAVQRLMNAEETPTPVIKAHYDTKKNKVHISSPVGEFNTMHEKTRNYHFSSKGTYMHVHAEDHNGKMHHIAKISFKDKSSPMTNIVGAVSHGKDYQALATK